MTVAASVGMLIYGIAMLKAYNAVGVYDDAEASKQYSERQGQFKQAFMESKTKYEEKVNEKAAPKIYPIKWTQQEEGFLENGHKKKG